MSGQRDLTDPVQMAIEATELRTGFESLRRELSQGFNHLSKTVENLQAEQRETRALMGEVVRHQAAMEAQSDGLKRAFKGIENLHSEFASWRNAHEDENQTVADAVTGFRGALRGANWVFGIVMLLCGTIVSMVLWIFNGQIQDGKDRDVAIQAKHERDTEALSKRLEVVETIQKQPYRGVGE